MTPEQPDHGDSTPAPDFLFVVVRPEFHDYVEPLIPRLTARGFTAAIADPATAAHSPPPRVVVTTNETPVITHFSQSRKVLLGHSMYMRDTVPTPVAQGAFFHLAYDVYFCPSTFYADWTLRGLMDAATFGTGGVAVTDAKTLIPGGYAKAFRPPNSPSPYQPADEPTGEPRRILYAPSVFSPEHTGHLCHEHGAGIVALLAALKPAAQVVCRPHPTDRHRDHVAALAEIFSCHPQIRMDLADTPAASLYHSPDVLVTDMSGFAFTFALATGRRPVFFLDRAEAARHPRFTALAQRFGRLAHDFHELQRIVRAQLLADDRLDTLEWAALSKAFYAERNTAESTAADLIAIAEGHDAPHWLRLSPAALGLA